MNCQDVRQLLGFARRKPPELDQAEQAELDQHLEKCAECAEHARLELRTDAVIAKSLADVPIPTDLKQKVLTRLAAERTVISWKVSVPAIAAVLLIALGVGWYLKPPTRITNDSVHEFGEFARGMDAGQVETWFAVRGYKIQAPRDLDYQYLRSLGIVEFQGKRVARLGFRNERDRDRPAWAEVLVLPHAQFRADSLRPETVGGGEFFPIQGDNFTYVVIYGGDFHGQLRNFQSQ
jgi:hypothetical protein